MQTSQTYIFTLANEERNVADAIVYSVRPLTEDEQVGIAEVFAKKIEKKMRSALKKIL
ncbi:hypothetical protein GCM10020331_023400 [Ectobacillus funiculus]